MDLCEEFAFAGCGDGKIYRLGLRPKVAASSIVAHSTVASAEEYLVGHTAPVTCLALSMDGLTLVSGSEDGNCRVWDTASQQCVRVYDHKGR
jgi:pre-rRNA-processing protein IPI3